MRGFTLIELIFVLIISGILMFTGLQFIPHETLTVDTQMLKQKILEKKSNALGYRYTGENNKTCIVFTKEWLNSDDNTTSQKVHYTFKSTITVTGLNNGDKNRVCFDYLGRPNDNNVSIDLTNLIHKNIIITLKYRNKEQNLTLYPISGFVR